MAGAAVLRGRHCEPCIEKSKEGGACPRCGEWLSFPPHASEGRNYLLAELAEKGTPVKNVLEKLEKAGIRDTLVLSHPSRDLKLPVPGNISAIMVAQRQVHLVSKANLGKWLFDS